jgi:hypothetical protein
VPILCQAGGRNNSNITDTEDSELSHDDPSEFIAGCGPYPDKNAAVQHLSSGYVAAPI